MSRLKFWTRPSRAVVGSGGGPASHITTPPLPPRHGAPDSTAGVRFCVFAHHGLLFTVVGDNIHKLLRPNKYCSVTMTVSISLVDNVRLPYIMHIAPLDTSLPLQSPGGGADGKVTRPRPYLLCLSRSPILAPHSLNPMASVSCELTNMPGHARHCARRSPVSASPTRNTPSCYFSNVCPPQSNVMQIRLSAPSGA